MIWGTNYYSSMDRGYESAAAPVRQASSPPIIDVHEIGQSVTEGRGKGTFLDTVNAAIRGGAGTIELSAAGETGEPGVGVESLGHEARRDLRDLAKINKVDLVSVHTPANVVGNLAGLGEKGYDESTREHQINEVKKHIDFAADVADGGAVVVHTGEFPRALAGNFDTPEAKFMAHGKEAEQEVIHLINSKTGEVVKQIKKDEVFGVPNFKTDDQGRFVDRDGRPILSPDREGDRIPVYRDNKFDVRPMSFDQFKNKIIQAGWLPSSASDAEFAQLLHKENMSSQVRSEQGWVQHYSRGYDQLEDLSNELRSDIRDWTSGDAARRREIYERKINRDVRKVISEDPRLAARYRTDPEGTVRSIRQDLEREGAIPAYDDFSRTFLDRARRESDNAYNQMKEMENMSMGHQQNVVRLREGLRDVIPLSEFAKEKTNESFIDLAEHAMEQSKHTSKPVFVAPENIFPTVGYGSHPEELIELVDSARKKFTDHLVTSRHMDRKQAEKEAKEHIKATLDTQHLGMWKRHLQRKAGESSEDYDKRFNNWYLDQVKKMQEAGVLGHIHIVDGFGRGHTHVVAGQGVMPVVEAIEELKKMGYGGSMISEAFGDVTHQLTGTWRAFGSNIYGTGAGVSDNWAGTESAYFNKVGGPTYIVGGYAKELGESFAGAPFYSGVGLE